jgi:hypothetical protein
MGASRLVCAMVYMSHTYPGHRVVECISQNWDNQILHDDPRRMMLTEIAHITTEELVDLARQGRVERRQTDALLHPCGVCVKGPLAVRNVGTKRERLVNDELLATAQSVPNRAILDVDAWELAAGLRVGKVEVEFAEMRLLADVVVEPSVVVDQLRVRLDHPCDGHLLECIR